MFGPPPAPESSPFLRYLSILASRSEGDFFFDDTRAMIKLAHIWIAESKNQEELNARLNTSTYNIMAALAPTIEEARPDPKKTCWVEEYDRIASSLHSCDVVTVKTRQEGQDGHREIRVSVSTTSRDDDSSRPMLKGLKDSEMLCNIEDLPVALEAQKENGYRRINCAAKANFFAALRLAYVLDYVDPDEPVDMRGDAARADDLRDEEDRLRRRN